MPISVSRRAVVWPLDNGRGGGLSVVHRRRVLVGMAGQHDGSGNGVTLCGLTIPHGARFLGAPGPWAACKSCELLAGRPAGMALPRRDPPTRAQVDAAVRAYLARGGRITRVPPMVADGRPSVDTLRSILTGRNEGGADWSLTGW